MDPETQAYLQELALTGEQIEFVVGLLQRVAASSAARDDDAVKRRIAGALSEAGIERDKIRDVMGVMERIVHEMQSEGEAFELDPGVQEYLVSIGLTDEQIALVVRLARRRVNHRTDDTRPDKSDDERRGELCDRSR